MAKFTLKQQKADPQGKREKSKADIQGETEIRDKKKINKEKTETQRDRGSEDRDPFLQK